MEHSQQPIAAAGTRLVEDVEQCDVMIIGSGVTGFYALYCCVSVGSRSRPARRGWRGGHLVLEPLPWGALRLRELYLRVFVPWRNSSRNGTGPSILPPSRRPSATSTLWRTSSTCAGTSANSTCGFGGL